ncbi:MAG TPA: SRPBCC family protein [Burkholderiaceae bacterium]|nr:SRPBCC family protein [Burkholderiaceae bacterium]
MIQPDPRADWLQPQPAETALALPAHCYVDEAVAAAERSAVFRSGWQLLAHAAQVAGSGDHAVADVAGLPLVLVRGSDGVLRALHNVCRHRAGPLATCDGRGATHLVCRYHGWTYALDGRLRGAPEMGRSTDFDPATIALPQARLAEWHGLVFAAAEDTAPPFEELVAGIDARAGAALADLAFDRRVVYEVACNWKVYVDNFLEGYHLPHVHPALNRVLDYRSYTTTLAPWSVLQASPIDASSGPYARGEALYYWLYPNTMLNILPGRLQTNRVIPLGVDRCRVEFDFYYAPDAGALRAGDLSFSDAVQDEDTAICEAVQRGLASGSYTAGRLNPLCEQGVWHFHELLRAAYRRARAQPPRR